MSKAELRIRRTTLFCVGFAAVLVGIACARIMPQAIAAGWLILFAPIALLLTARRTLVSLLVVALCGLLLGWWRGDMFYAKIAPYKEFNGKKVTVQVRADSSGVYAVGSQLQFDATHVEFLSPVTQKLPGMMVVSGYGVNSVLRGDTVTVTGKLYSRRGSKQAGISYGQLQVVSRSASVIEKFRRNFLAGLNTALPEPLNQFAAGLLIGQRSELPQNVTTTLQIVGLSHVIAVSGYNLTIMAEVVRKKMGKKSKFRSTVVSLGLILLFLAVAGSSASIARAAFVSILTVIAAHYGRTIKPLLLILLAASYTAFMNPLNIWTDIGWYLSFLAFFGVLILAPAIQKRFFGAKKEPNTALLVMIETASAQIMTIPIGMFIFGQVSLIALVANMIVVPLVPLAMLLSVIAGLSGMWLPLASGILALPARLLLGFMLSVCSLLARIPHALASIKIGVVTLVSMYAALLLGVVVMTRKTPKYDKIAAE